MTALQRLIVAQTKHTTVTTISAATAKIAEEIAREIIREPAFKASMKALIRDISFSTVSDLAKNGRKPRTRRR
jgi:hypothetical protein